MWRIGAAALSLVLLAAPAAAQKQGGTATLGLELDIPGLDQLKVGVYDTAATSAAALLFDTLTRLDDEGAPQPKLAQSWTTSEYFKVWTFKLQSGVKFPDGTLLGCRRPKGGGACPGGGRDAAGLWSRCAKEPR